MQRFGAINAIYESMIESILDFNMKHRCSGFAVFELSYWYIMIPEAEFVYLAYWRKLRRMGASCDVFKLSLFTAGVKKKVKVS